jgi:hypothetical protein
MHLRGGSMSRKVVKRRKPPGFLQRQAGDVSGIVPRNRMSGHFR